VRAFGGEYYNPDEAAKRLMAARPGLKQTEANAAAWHQGRRLLERAIAERLDFAFETTLGGSTLARLLALAADKGAEVHLLYIGLASPELHIARVRARVRAGGHDIPEGDIRRRYEHSRLNLIHLLPKLASLRVYDNSAEADPARGRTPEPKLVLHLRRKQPGRPAAHARLGEGGGRGCAEKPQLARAGSPSPASTITSSFSPALLRRRKAAASWYSFDLKHATPCSKLGNSMTTKRLNFSGPSSVWQCPPRASTFAPYFARIAGTRSVYFLYSTGSLTLPRASQYAGMGPP
jgi:predicted ABC-type ATPase